MKRKILENSAKLFCQAFAFRLIKRGLTQLTDEELTEVQLACIRFVQSHPDPSVGAIANGLAVSDAAAAKLIDRLVKKGILVREEDPVDRRVLKIKLTSSGTNLLKTVNEYEISEFNSIVSRMAPEDLASLQKGLVAFIKAAVQEPEEVEKICLRCGVEHFPDCPGNILYRELTGKDKENI